jgi:hypothetical protein
MKYCDLENIGPRTLKEEHVLVRLGYKGLKKSKLFLQGIV